MLAYEARDVGSCFGGGGSGPCNARIDRRGVDALKVGEPAPDFELMLLDKSKVRLADLRGQVVVLNYWATWCAPCKKELPLLDHFYRTLQGKGLRVYASLRSRPKAHYHSTG